MKYAKIDETAPKYVGYVENMLQEMKYAKIDETAPKYVGYVNMLQEMKTTERKRISKVDAKQTVYDELSPNLEPKVNGIQLSYHFRYSAISTQIARI
jgi:hypothetical protein